MLHDLATVLPADVTTGGLQSWIRSNIIPLLLLVIATMLFVVAQKGDNAKAMRVVAGVVVALGVLGLAARGEAQHSKSNNHAGHNLHRLGVVSSLGDHEEHHGDDQEEERDHI